MTFAKWHGCICCHLTVILGVGILLLQLLAGIFGTNTGFFVRVRCLGHHPASRVLSTLTPFQD